MSKSDGSTADYYQLPSGSTELQHLISHRNMNAQDGEIFRSIYRKGRASHSDELRDAKKVLFYAKAEVERLEKLAAPSPINASTEQWPDESRRVELPDEGYTGQGGVMVRCPDCNPEKCPCIVPYQWHDNNQDRGTDQ